MWIGLQSPRLTFILSRPLQGLAHTRNSRCLLSLSSSMAAVGSASWPRNRAWLHGTDVGSRSLTWWPTLDMWPAAYSVLPPASMPFSSRMNSDRFVASYCLDCDNRVSVAAVLRLPLRKLAGTNSSLRVRWRFLRRRAARSEGARFLAAIVDCLLA